MKLENVMMMLAENGTLDKTLNKKGMSIAKENNAFQNDLILLKQEVQKRNNETMLFYKNEYNKLLLKHNLNKKNISLQ